MTPRKPEYVRLLARQRFRYYKCRCSRCEHRATIRKLPWLLRKPLACDRCGSHEWRVDVYRTMRTERRRYLCGCPAWWFPHRRGSCAAGFNHGKAAA